MYASETWGSRWNKEQKRAYADACARIHSIYDSDPTDMQRLWLLERVITRRSVADLMGCVQLRLTNAGKAWLASRGLAVT